MIDDIKRPKPSLKEIFPPKLTARPVTTERPTFQPTPVAPRNEKHYQIVEEPERGSRRKLYLWLVVFLVLIGAGFILFGSFASAVVTVVPKQATLSLNEVITAYDKPTSAEELAFQIMSIEESASKMITAKGVEKVDKKASGQITVYNSHSVVSQKLISSTRFESPTGLIFRIPSAVVVPGFTKNAKGEITPGRVEVTVIADQPGSNYNLGLVDWTIPGFKNDPKYKNFIGKSKTPMTGGASGERRVADKTDEAKTREELKQVLTDKLKARAQSELLDTFVLYPNSLAIQFSSADSITPGEALATEMVEVKEQAKLWAVIFNRSEFESYLIKRKKVDLKEVYEIVNITDLKFNMSATDLARLNSNPDKLDFSLIGEANLVASFNRQELVTKLLGLKKSDYSKVFQTYLAIKSASAVFKPPWINHFPTDPKKITIETVIK